MNGTVRSNGGIKKWWKWRRVFPCQTELRNRICEAALQLMRNAGYTNAGTVEFLVTPIIKFYFIEVNPRVQVEHTITEMITGIDIVQSQIRIAEGYALTDPEVGMPPQEEITTHGYAIQCRVTTEDPHRTFCRTRADCLPTVPAADSAFGWMWVTLSGAEHYAALRFTSGQSFLLGAQTLNRQPKDVADVEGIPHPRSENQYSVFGKCRATSGVLNRRL